MVIPDRRLVPLVAALNKWRAAGFIIFYLVLIPAAVLYIAIAAQTGLRNDNRQDKELRVQARQGASAKAAICTLRANYIQKVVNGKAFLVTNPDGIAGISPAVLKASIRQNQETVDALAGLNCR